VGRNQQAATVLGIGDELITERYLESVSWAQQVASGRDLSELKPASGADVEKFTEPRAHERQRRQFAGLAFSHASDRHHGNPFPDATLTQQRKRVRNGAHLHDQRKRR
jgi:hypothetical protein